ncbi:hypothetical protein L249_7925 [Ophiocordyceps polyrhachis-furcata BCC 54312]|uniref:Uncharacterized protein n=1 Tax=Ophiocordyceps polyrhachis-furcata BCC 54312 TaxID=1330021 RepID=A0A367LHD2_9HYPO|nr:hypothetical protein L249_7925 [Ophiocordyceps polyrhachis-furcata BCC 54312]
METVSNMAAQAAKLVWGGNPEEKEPISGAQGNVSRGEPFDAGNMDPSHQQTMSTTAGSNRDASTQPNIGKSSHVDNSRQVDPISQPSTVAAAETETPKVTDERESQVEERVTSSRTSDDGASKPQTADDSRAPKTVSGKGSATTGKATEESHDDGETGDPNTGIMGDGPKPLDVVAEENGGDAGNNVDTKHKSENDDENDTRSRDQKSKGTGEMHVMTSGFAADGGDFDATKPGAGREADRLMEEKKGHAGAEPDGTGSTQEKPSLGDRLKNKLHKH